MSLLVLSSPSNSDRVQYTSRYCIIHHLTIRHCLSFLSHIDVIDPPIIFSAQLLGCFTRHPQALSDLRSTSGCNAMKPNTPRPRRLWCYPILLALCDGTDGRTHHVSSCIKLGAIRTTIDAELTPAVPPRNLRLSTRALVTRTANQASE